MIVDNLVKDRKIYELSDTLKTVQESKNEETGKLIIMTELKNVYSRQLQTKNLELIEEDKKFETELAHCHRIISEQDTAIAQLNGELINVKKASLDDKLAKEEKTSQLKADFDFKLNEKDTVIAALKAEIEELKKKGIIHDSLVAFLT